MKKIIFILLIVSSMAIVFLTFNACSIRGTDTSVDDGQTTEEPANQVSGDTAEVTMLASSFDPPTLTISQGTTVVWNDTSGITHTVTSGVRGDQDAGSLFDSGNITPNGQYSYTFDNPGEFKYFCRIHVGMDGVIIVE